MRLGREKNRTDKSGKTHYKWRLTPSEELIRQLGWEAGDDLEATVKSGNLVLRKAR